MSHDLTDPAEVSVPASDLPVIQEHLPLRWIIVGAIALAGLIVWWLGFLFVVRSLVWLVLAASCVGIAGFYWLSVRKSGKEGAEDRTVANCLIAVAAGAVVALLLIPKPRVELTQANLKTAAVTLVGRYEEANLLLSDKQEWHGSAFVYRRKGSSLLLYTNAHCLGLQSLIEDSSWEFDGQAEIASFNLSITFPSGKIRPVHRIAGSTELRDVACLEVPGGGLKEGRDYLIVPTMGNCLSRLGVRAGDEVIALGSPLDPRLEGTQTFGRISAVRDDPTGVWLQHDAGINPGNSGGPLFLSRRGKLYWIGINTLGVREGHSIGFSISADDVTSGDYQWVDADEQGLATLIRTYGGRARHVE